MKKHDDDVFGINTSVNEQPKEEFDFDKEYADEAPKDKKSKKEKTAKTSKKTAPKQGKRKKQRITIAIVMVVVFGLASFIVYYGLNKENYYDKYYTVGEMVSGKTLDIVFSEVSVATSFPDFTMENGQVYVQAVYTVTNKTDAAVSCNEIPYLSLQKFTASNKGYAYTEAEEGVFDYSALLSLSIERGYDYSTIKDDIQPGETKQLADVFKISSASFNMESYFISFDNIKAIVNIGGTYDPTTKQITPSPQPPAAAPAAPSGKNK